MVGKFKEIVQLHLNGTFFIEKTALKEKYSLKVAYLTSLFICLCSGASPRKTFIGAVIVVLIAPVMEKKTKPCGGISNGDISEKL